MGLPGRVVQSIAQMWNRIGVTAKAEVMPWSIYFPKAGKREFSIWLLSSGSIAEMATALNSVVVTHDPKNGKGVNNRGRYSNPQLDDLVNTAFLTLDDAIDRLAAEDPAAAELVRLRYYGGLSVEEAAGVAGVSRASAYRQWAYARAWLRLALGEGGEGAGE